MRILIAEDEAVSRRILESALRKSGYEVTIATNGLEAWEMLQQPDAPTLAILDWMMPGIDGSEVCRRMRLRGGQNYTYLILLTSKSGKEDIIEGLEAGADDYLVKPFDSSELYARLNVGKRIIELHSQLVHVCEELRGRATRDSLTGLLNHAAIHEALDHELERSSREGKSLGVVMADLDHFKRINDTHGHPVGDAVLRETTRCFRSMLRPYDSLGRYGGEEFLIVLPGCGPADTVRTAERLCVQLAATKIHVGGTLIPVTVSLGSTSHDGKSAIDAMTLLQIADSTLYEAKRAGRNRVEFRQSRTAGSPAKADTSSNVAPAPFMATAC